MPRHQLLYLFLGIALISACSPTSSLTAVSPTAPPPAETAPAPTAGGEPLAPAGWATHNSQSCEYTISYPSEMQVSRQTPYSEIIGFKPTTDHEAAPNFVYVSVIAPEVQSMAMQGAYDHSVYNYDPVGSQTLLGMHVGEVKAVREAANVKSGFTYERQPDTTIDGNTAQAYENVQPWEFPAGTKEIRYYVPVSRCTYLIGGYMDTTQSKKAGTMTEEVFNQIMATIHLMP